MKLSQYGYDFSADLLAKYPAENRDESRLMVVNRAKGTIEHRIFKEIIEYFDEKDLFIFNDTKVFPARLYGNKEKTGARIEVFLLRELNEDLRLWDVLVDPARKIRIGNKLYFGEDDSMVAEVIDNTTSRGRTLRFLYDGPHDEFKAALYALGEAPLLCKEGVVALGDAFQLGRPRLDVGGKGFFLLCGVFGTGAGGVQLGFPPLHLILTPGERRFRLLHSRLEAFLFGLGADAVIGRRNDLALGGGQLCGQRIHLRFQLVGAVLRREAVLLEPGGPDAQLFHLLLAGKEAR